MENLKNECAHSENVLVAANAPEQNSRRDFMKQAGALLGAAGIMSMVPMGTRASAWAGGSDAPELKEVKVGFIPLTDCASVVMASMLKLDEKYGIKITLSKEASWAGVRDKLVNGELHAAHVLYGLIYGVELGIGGQQKDMAVLMTLNNNGQGITLSNQLKDKGVTSGETLKKLVDSEKRDYTFAQTFPTGTHAMWLYYWLANYGINPLADVKTITVPPPQMVANMRVGNMDGFCVGEPWNNRAIYDKIGFSAATTQDIWKDHPEKVLGTTAEFAHKYPNTARALIMAVLEASQYIDTMANRHKVAEIIADKSYVNCPVDVIDQRFEGHYEDGLGKKWNDSNYMKFCNDGAVNFPYLSDGMWFMTQQKRWGLLKTDPDYLAVAKKINQIDLYKQAASQV
jgi:nitrate/nitrite transport system substrate-binding protein